MECGTRAGIVVTAGYLRRICCRRGGERKLAISFMRRQAVTVENSSMFARLSVMWSWTWRPARPSKLPDEVRTTDQVRLSAISLFALLHNV